MEGFIKIYNKMLNWEWYDDNNTFRVFMHCLLRANWKAGSWHGINYEAGQFITSLATLAKETHLTVKQVRTALEHLKGTGEVADLRQGNCRIITVLKWNEYQCEGRPKGKPRANQGQTEGKPGATDKEYKDIKDSKDIKEIKHIYGEYHHVRLTEAELNKLCDEYGTDKAHEAIKYLDEYIEMKGYKAKSHYLCIRKWVFDAVNRDQESKKPIRNDFLKELAEA